MSDMMFYGGTDPNDGKVDFSSLDSESVYEKQRKDSAVDITQLDQFRALFGNVFDNLPTNNDKIIDEKDTQLQHLKFLNEAEQKIAERKMKVIENYENNKKDQEIVMLRAEFEAMKQQQQQPTSVTEPVVESPKEMEIQEIKPQNVIPEHEPESGGEVVEDENIEEETT